MTSKTFMQYIYFIISPWYDIIYVDSDFYLTLYRKNIFKEITFNDYFSVLVYEKTGEIVIYKMGVVNFECI